jgi:Putative SAM-dependent methyltransferase
MIITTAGRTTSSLTFKAKTLAGKYGVLYKERNRLSIEEMKNQFQDHIIVVGKEGIYISLLNGKTKLFFHPNLGMVRAKRLLKGEQDPLIQTAKLQEGMWFLDCTLGLAADSIIASLAVGKTGFVTGIEGNEMLHFLVKEGLENFHSGKIEIDHAMRRIDVVHHDHLAFLKQVEDKSYHVVYLDPMFQEAIEASNGINAIREQALTTDITPELIAEAKRVATDRIVIKDHFRSDRFQRFGFTQHIRKTSLFHYGTIELNCENPSF